MKWYAISGSWNLTNEQVKKDVQKLVRKIIKKDDGIITGGALGVDFYATQQVLELNKPEKIKVYLPISLQGFCNHYLKRAEQGVITKKQAEEITTQLKKLASLNRDSMIDKTEFTKADRESYYARNKEIIENCDILYAFQVNESEGTQDAINRAKMIGKKAILKKYRIPQRAD